jgi:hypothetical protein
MRSLLLVQMTAIQPGKEMLGQTPPSSSSRLTAHAQVCDEGECPVNSATEAPIPQRDEELSRYTGPPVPANRKRGPQRLRSSRAV